jgi:hypothetical protein
MTTLSSHGIARHIPRCITSQITRRLSVRFTSRITAVHEAESVKTSYDLTGQIFPLDHQPAITFIRPAV